MKGRRSRKRNKKPQGTPAGTHKPNEDKPAGEQRDPQAAAPPPAQPKDIEPKPPHCCAAPGESKRDWIDRANLGVLFLTFWAAVAAAGFTGYLAWLGRDTAEKQLRAYLFPNPAVGNAASIRNPSNDNTVDDVVEGRNPHMMIQIRNIGQTPAYEVTYKAGITVMPVSVLLGLSDVPLPENKERTYLSIVYPGSTEMGLEAKGVDRLAGVTTLTKDDVATIATGKDNLLVVFGHIDYLDIYGSKQWTDFCFGFYGAGPSLSTMRYCPHHNDASR
jgi:hypothetical protein